MLVNQGEQLATIGCLSHHVEAGTLQEARKAFAQQDVVVRHDDAYAHAATVGVAFLFASVAHGVSICPAWRSLKPGDHRDDLVTARLVGATDPHLDSAGKRRSSSRAGTPDRESGWRSESTRLRHANALLGRLKRPSVERTKWPD
jgi:hypothetical protein